MQLEAAEKLQGVLPRASTERDTNSLQGWFAACGYGSFDCVSYSASRSNLLRSG